MKFATHFTVSATHLDLLGHVNNASYLTLFEEARWQIAESAGFKRQDFVSCGVGPILLELTIRYRRELRLNETVTVETSEGRLQDKYRFVVRQRMVNSRGQTAATGEFLLAAMDLGRRKLMVLPSMMMQAFSICSGEETLDEDGD